MAKTIRNNTAKPGADERVERRTFQAHANLVLQVIKRQAGTLAKSIMEGVMNAEDAGASRIDVTITATHVHIRDDGKGFDSADSIKQIFEVFGQPHDLDDNGVSTDAKFGTFRIGRGQLFAFGRNTWRSNSFRMETDIDRNGLDYNLVSGAGHTPGCQIEVELYAALSPHDVDTTVRDVTKLCKYLTIPLYVNEKKVSIDPRGLKWDVNNELAYISKKPVDGYGRGGSLDVYQQGVFVESIPAYEYGVEGTVAIKSPVQLNFARNQVIRSCKQWAKIARLLRDTGLEETKKKTKLTAAEASNFVAQFAAGVVELPDLQAAPCLADTSGRLWAVHKIAQLADSSAESAPVYAVGGQVRIGFGPRGCRKADMVRQQRKAIVFDEQLLNTMKIPPGKLEERAKLFFQKIMPKSPRYKGYPLLFVDYTSLLDVDPMMLLPPQQWTDNETDVAYIAGKAMWSLMRGTSGSVAYRKVLIGICGDAQAWTDGRSYVALERKFVAGLNLSQERGWTKLVLVLIHEMCHTEPDTSTHDHTPEFFEDYHNLTMQCAAEVARGMVVAYRGMLERRGRKLSSNIRNEINAAAMAAAVAHKTLGAQLCDDYETLRPPTQLKLV